MATQYAPAMYLSDRVMNCTGALEAFHRLHFDGGRKTKTPLRVRLAECVDLVGEPFASLLVDRDAWLRRVVAERNDAAHQLDNVIRSDSAEAFWVWKSLYLMFAGCMLRVTAAPHSAFEAIAAHAGSRRLHRELAAALTT
jgi:hypothetical protein